MARSTIKAFIFCLIFAPLCVLAYVSPGKPQGFVSDFAGIMNAADIQTANSQLSTLEKSNGVEIAVVTVPSLGDESVETYAVKLFQEWGIGNKAKDNGLLILVAPNDRAAKIEVGYGLEGTVTDLQSGNIMNKVMIPAFKANDYSGGIKGTVGAVVAIISNSSDAAEFSTPSNSNSAFRSKTPSGSASRIACSLADCADNSNSAWRRTATSCRN